MKAQTRQIEGVTVLDIIDELNTLNLAPYKDALKSLEGKKVVVNLSKVTYIDSAGMAALIEFAKAQKQHNLRLYLTYISDKINGVFKLTKAHQFFECYSNDETAIKKMNSEA